MKLSYRCENESLINAELLTKLVLVDQDHHNKTFIASDYRFYSRLHQNLLKLALTYLILFNQKLHPEEGVVWVVGNNIIMNIFKLEKMYLRKNNFGEAFNVTFF